MLKKVSSIVLALAMLMTMVTAVSAESTVMVAKEDFEGYDSNFSQTGNNSFGIWRTQGGANTTVSVDATNPDNKALKIENEIGTFNEMLTENTSWLPSGATSAELNYSVNFSDKLINRAVIFRGLTESSTPDMFLLMFNSDGTVTLGDKTISGFTYEAEKWYDVKYVYNFSTGYMNVEITDGVSTVKEQTTYSGAKDNFYITRLDFASYGGSTSGTSAYLLDNISLNAVDDAKPYFVEKTLVDVNFNDYTASSSALLAPWTTDTNYAGIGYSFPENKSGDRNLNLDIPSSGSYLQARYGGFNVSKADGDAIYFDIDVKFHDANSSLYLYMNSAGDKSICGVENASAIHAGWGTFTKEQSNFNIVTGTNARWYKMRAYLPLGGGKVYFSIVDKEDDTKAYTTSWGMDACESFDNFSLIVFGNNSSIEIDNIVAKTSELGKNMYLENNAPVAEINFDNYTGESSALASPWTADTNYAGIAYSFPENESGNRNLKLSIPASGSYLQARYGGLYVSKDNAEACYVDMDVKFHDANSSLYLYMSSSGDKSICGVENASTLHAGWGTFTKDQSNFKIVTGVNARWYKMRAFIPFGEGKVYFSIVDKDDATKAYTTSWGMDACDSFENLSITVFGNNSEIEVDNIKVHNSMADENKYLPYEEAVERNVTEVDFNDYSSESSALASPWTVETNYAGVAYSFPERANEGRNLKLNIPSTGSYFQARYGGFTLLKENMSNFYVDVDVKFHDANSSFYLYMNSNGDKSICGVENASALRAGWGTFTEEDSNFHFVTGANAHWYRMRAYYKFGEGKVYFSIRDLDDATKSFEASWGTDACDSFDQFSLVVFGNDSEIEVDNISINSTDGLVTKDFKLEDADASNKAASIYAFAPCPTENVIVAIAAYDKQSGEMIDCNTKVVNNASGYNTFKVETNILENADKYNYKAFAWTSDLKPLYPAIPSK